MYDAEYACDRWAHMCSWTAYASDSATTLDKHGKWNHNNNRLSRFWRKTIVSLNLKGPGCRKSATAPHLCHGAAVMRKRLLPLGRFDVRRRSIAAGLNLWICWKYSKLKSSPLRASSILGGGSDSMQ